MIIQRWMGAFAFGAVGLAMLAVGCTSSSKTNEPAPDPCASACGDPCGGTEETSGDPLEKKFAKSWKVAVTLKGDAAAGKKFYFEKTYGNLMTCNSCHAMDKGDSMSLDAGAYQRAGVSIYGANWRTNIKGGGGSNATLGGDACVTYWMDGPSEGAEPQDLANLKAFLDAESGPKDHATSGNIDWKARSYTIAATLTGGDAENGAKLAIKYCGTCHSVDGKEPLVDIDERGLKGGTIPADRLSRVAARIKDSGQKNNDFMPGFSDQRMPEKDLIDILAFFAKK